MNRNVILAAAVALMVGLWGGVVLGRSGAGGAPSWFQAKGQGAQPIRGKNAPRMGLMKSGDMAFERLRIETEGEAPTACLEFTKTLANDGALNFSDFVKLEPAAPAQFEAVGNSLCLRGLPYDIDRQLTILEGLPAADGAKTRKDETFTLTFGDRPSFVGFAGNGVILPRAEADGLGIETVNAAKLKIEVLRVSDRILARANLEEGLSVAEGSWDYWSVESMGSDFGVSVFKGEIDVAGTERPPGAKASAGPTLTPALRNKTQTTVFPLGAVLKDKKPGAYVVRVLDGTPSAGARGENNNRPAGAARWIMMTDLALQTFEGADGMDVVVRSLKTARTVGGVTLSLVAENNDELARVRTNGQGHVRFPGALLEGDGPLHARAILAYGANGDFAALDLDRGTVDMSERDISGRNSPGDVDAFMYADRGIYRPGETVKLNAMLRDDAGRAIGNRKSTLIVYRPNGTEARRMRLAEAKDAGAISKDVALDRSAPRGLWRASLEVDGQEVPAGELSFAVEDFVPQRLKVEIKADETPLLAGQTRAVSVDAQFLFGAPGAGLNVEGEGRLTVDPNPFPEQKGYSWGKSDEAFEERLFTIPSVLTDGAGRADLQVALNDQPATNLPLRARIVASVAEPGGRVVREGFAFPVRLAGLYIGVKPRGEAYGNFDVGKPVGFDVVTVNSSGQRNGARLSWRLVEEDWRYDWYMEGGRWKWRRTGRDVAVAGAQGNVNVTPGEPLQINQDKLREGQYRLILSHESGVETTYRFGVGWGGDAGDSDTPDTVAVIAPEKAVRIGNTVRVQIKPPYAGEAQIVIANDRVLSMRSERIPAEGKTISIRADQDWGAGAYVLVTVVTPRDPAGRSETPVVPRRAIGVTYVPVDSKARHYDVKIADGLGVVRPRTRVEVPVQVTGGPRETVRMTLALVDEGILQLTKFETPDPKAHYFARKALGVSLRDDYGRLLNPNLGAPATPRQGGDSLGGEGLTVVPTKTIALWSGVVKLRNGRAKIPVDIPDFNGQLRLMAVAFSETGLGSGAAPLTIRDPVVAELTLPRFLAPGDEAVATLRLDNVEGPAGAYQVTVTGQGAAQSQSGAKIATLNTGANATMLIPVKAPAAGIGKLNLQLSGPAGFTALNRAYDIQVRTPFLPVTEVDVQPQAPGATYTLTANALDRFAVGEGRAIVSYSSLRGVDPAPLLDSLDRYPYGCTEQLVSVTAPLLYANTLAPEAARERDTRITPRINAAITQILDRQTPDGAIGLWSAGDGAATGWLGAYSVDFLRRAKAAGYVVPDAPLELAYAGLRAVARLNDFENVAYRMDTPTWPGNPDTTELLRSRSSAYALYVLAKAGQADIGQVRYFHDARLSKEPSPLARGHIGAALAHLGDRARAKSAFRKAEQALGYKNAGDYYQSPVRDLAGLIALASEAAKVDPSLNELVNRLAKKLEGDAPRASELMTQEQAQMLYAANALLQAAGPVRISRNGETPGAMSPFTALADTIGRGATFRNDGTGATWRTLTLAGAPRAAPGPGSQGLSIDKRVFRMNGELANLDGLRQGDRVVVSLSVTPEGQRLYPTVVVDLLPAGLEIESILGPADGEGETLYDGRRIDGPFGWLGRIAGTRVAEKRDDRFVAALDLQGRGATVAYVARAVTPGAFIMPGGVVEDLYKPGVFGRSAAGRLRIAPQ
jgi:uncharacterized protein YfaS (alpha-2-macroglobulin family)